MRSFVNIILTLIFAAICGVIGFYCWPLLVGYAMYRVAKHYVMRYRASKRAVRRVPHVLYLR